MTRSSNVKNQQKFRLARNVTNRRKTNDNVAKKTRKLQTDLISDMDQPTGNEHFTYKKRSFAGPSCQKLNNFLEQQNTDVDEDANDYYQIIHNWVLLELMKQTICISCKLLWNGCMSVTNREGSISLVFLQVKLYDYI